MLFPQHLTSLSGGAPAGPAAQLCQPPVLPSHPCWLSLPIAPVPGTSPGFSSDTGSCPHPVREGSRLLPPISSHCHPSQPRVSSSSSDSGQPSSLSSAIGPLRKTCPDWKLSSFLSSSAPHPGRPSLRHSSTHFSWNCSHFLPPWISSAEPH